MPVIDWSEGVPQGSDSLGQGDEVIKSLKSSIRIGLDAEHIWPSGGGDAGVHRLGSARPYYGTQSLVSSSGTDARLMMTSDTSRLFGVGSGGTVFIGGAGVISMASFPGMAAPQRSHWVEETGTANTSNGDTGLVSFANAYQGVPYMQFSILTNETTSARAFSVWADQIGNTTFRAQVRKFVGTGDPIASGVIVTVHWRSIGTRAL